MILENQYLHVEIAELGAELMRIYDRTAETELLWWGDGAFWKRRSPILFPNVGRTFNNTMLINGVSYATTQHGFARDRMFVLEDSSDMHATFLLCSDEETLKRYPFHFELRIRYTLEGKTLSVLWLVKNTSVENMYFTIGGHPAFCFASPEDKKEDYYLSIPGRESLSCVQLDPVTFSALPDQKREIKLENGVLPLSEELFANDALVLDGCQVEVAWLCHKDGTPRIGMVSKDFPNYGIWSVKGAPFVCLEPWAGRGDNYGFEEEVSRKPNINCVIPGETFEKGYQLLVP